MKKTTTSSRNFFSKWVLSTILLCYIACSEEHIDPDTDSDLTFEEVLNAGGEFESFPQSRTTEVLATSDPINEDYVVGEGANTETPRFFCQTKTLSVLDGNGQFPLFDPNADVIYPGNLLQGKSLPNATPSPVPVKRAGGTISYNLNNGNLTSSFTVDEVRKSTIQDAMNNIIANSPDAVPSNFQLDIEEVHSESQLAIEIGIDVETFSAKVSADMSFSTENEFNRFLVKLNQQYYTMSFDLPTSKADIFDPGVTPDDLSTYIQEDNPATFISSVTYGRIFYMLVESTSSSQEMATKLNASYGAFNNKVEGSVEIDAFNSLENVKIKVIAYGGDAKGTFQLTGETSISAIADQLAQDTDIRAGLPLSYVVRSVERPDIVVGTKLATEYDVVECQLKGVLPPAGFEPLVDLFADGIGAATQIGGQFVVLYNGKGDQYVLYDGITAQVSQKYEISDASGPMGATSFSAVTAAVRAFKDEIYIFNENGTQFEIIDYNATPKSMPASPFGNIRQGGDNNAVFFINNVFTSNLLESSVDFPFASDGIQAALRKSHTFFDLISFSLYHTINYYYSAETNGATYAEHGYFDYVNSAFNDARKWSPETALNEVDGFPFESIEAACKIDFNQDEKLLYFTADGQLSMYSINDDVYEGPWVIN